MAKHRIRIATRKSQLAVWQAEFVANKLRSLKPEVTIELLRMTTRGDKILHSPLANIGGKGLFVKELEQAMLRDEADLAVHSMKDVPVTLPPGLRMAAILQREDPRDVLVSNKIRSYSALPPGAVIGTSSLRRQMQLRALHPQCKVLDLRGNVNTRLQKLESGQYDAILLAAAGLKRLGYEDRISAYLDPSESLPAIGQGAIGVECREDDHDLVDLLQNIHDQPTDLRVRCERSMNARLNGGCQVPIAGFAEIEQQQLRIRGLVGELDGSRMIRAELCGPSSNPEELGRQTADQLLDRGAKRILEQYIEL